MARLQNPQIVVHNTSPDGSLRGAAMQGYKIPAITVEIGDPARFQKQFVKSAILEVTNVLSHLKMIEDEHEV
jgi:predicted deacylase